MLNSLRSRKKSDHKAVKFSYKLNFRHSRFISYLFTIHRQGLLHFTPYGIHFNYDSQNRFLSTKSRFTEHKKTGSRRHENTLGARYRVFVAFLARSNCLKTAKLRRLIKYKFILKSVVKRSVAYKPNRQINGKERR